MLSSPSRARDRARPANADLPVLASWRVAGACGASELDLFFVPDEVSPAERRRRETAAKQVCARCRVRRECLRYAVRTGERFGIWGGTTPTERLTERLAERSR